MSSSYKTSSCSSSLIAQKQRSLCHRSDLDDSGVHLDDCLCERDDSDICRPFGGGRSRDVVTMTSRSQQQHVALPGQDGVTSRTTTTTFLLASSSSESGVVTSPSSSRLRSSGGDISETCVDTAGQCGHGLTVDDDGHQRSPLDVFYSTDNVDCTSSLRLGQTSSASVAGHCPLTSFCLDIECPSCDVIIRSAPDSSVAVPFLSRSQQHDAIRSSCCAEVEVRSAPDNPITLACPTVKSRQSAFLSSTLTSDSASGGSAGRTRFKRFFEPLRRSQSAGNNPQKDLSTTPTKHEHAQQLFLTRTVTDQSLNGRLQTSADKDHVKKRSLTSEVRDRLSSLGRRCIELALSSKDSSSKPSVDTIRCWANSLDSLLADKFGRQCFHEFLKSEFSEENVEFWIACEEFKNLKTPNLTAPAQKIFNEFIAHQAPREINIDSITRDLTYANMSNGADKSMFEPAQRRIQALMDKDSYPRFLQSDLYLYLLNQATSTGSSSSTA